MKKILLLSSLITKLAFASPVGVWETISDETQQPQSIVEIYQAADGTLEGRVLELITKPGAICDKCSGELKDKPIKGMKILWGLKPKGNKWTSGKVFDAGKGKTYGAEIEEIDGGQALKVTGKLLVFSRSQVWKRK